MKQLQSTTEGAWIELLQVDLTVAEQTLLMSIEESDREAQTALHTEIGIRRNGIAAASDIEVAQAKYEEIKPVLKPNAVYQLIAMDCTIDGEVLTGILNCRVDGEHLQFRF